MYCVFYCIHSCRRHKTDPSKSLVINVEYNQLDPLLRTQGDMKGDVADPSTGYSPYPGKFRTRECKKKEERH